MTQSLAPGDTSDTPLAPGSRASFTKIVKWMKCVLANSSVYPYRGPFLYEAPILGPHRVAYLFRLHLPRGTHRYSRMTNTFLRQQFQGSKMSHVLANALYCQ